MYILKLILCFGIFEISTYIGMWLSKKLEKKVNEYNEINDILVFIESSIKYTNNNLIQIFSEVINQTDKSNFKNLFLNINDLLNDGKYTIYECFEYSIEKYKHEFSCKLDVLKELSKMLGKSDVEGQIKNINLYKERIKVLICDSINSKNKNEKVYKTLGMVCGIMLVIVLI